MKNPVVFVCDVQDKFRDAIHEFDKIVLTIEKLLKFASNLSLPVHATTQNAPRLGATVPSIAALLPSPAVDKTRFSMLSASGDPTDFTLPPASQVALVGIESHICITQTALDLKARGHTVYVIADGVSSCNRAEVVVALDRLRGEEGVVVTTSESWMYEVVGDASIPAFKAMFPVVKGAMADTKKVLEALPPGSKI